MFERLKKAMTGTAPPEAASTPGDALSEWARAQGFALSRSGEDKGFLLQGEVSGRPWKLERGAASRQFILGEELRARAELKLNEDVSVLVMNRPLKDLLEKRAYEMYTDTLQTSADPDLPEEMRWLAMYAEVGWSDLPGAFSDRYAVMADQREHALAWLDPALTSLMLAWPAPAPAAEVPFIMMLMRGKLYLRMQYTPADMPTLQHAAAVFTSASEAAISRLSTDIPL